MASVGKHRGAVDAKPLEAVVEENTARESKEGNVQVDENVGRALGCTFIGNDCEHVGSAAETIGEEEDVGVTSRRDRRGRSNRR